MKKIVNAQFDETWYTHTLDNGLNLIFWHKPDFVSTAVVFATPYGALDYRQIDKAGNHLDFPSGIAHFLEHKLFESDEGDVMEDFSRMGANVNAFTSYNETCYYFTTSHGDLKEPLNLLIDFVQDLRITDESVEKEKGIINQELKMYLQMPDSRLFFETFKALYHKHPLNRDIGGDEQSVNATTRQQLQDCYELNYHPSRMTLIVAGPQNPQTLLEWIEENQKPKSFAEAKDVGRYLEEEPEAVVSSHTVIPMDVAVRKVSVAYKFAPLTTSAKERVRREWAIRCLLESHFSSLNPDYQKWLDNEVINDYFGYEIDLGKDYAMMMFYNETEDATAFTQFVEEQLNALKTRAMDYQQLQLLKRRYFGEAMRTFNNMEDIAVAMIRNQFNGVSFFDTLEIIDQLDQKQVQDAFESLSFNQRSVVEISPAEGQPQA